MTLSHILQFITVVNSKNNISDMMPHKMDGILLKNIKDTE